MQRRIAADLARSGHPWPARAALLLAVRGRLGLGRGAFAALVDVPEDVVAALEDGDPPRGHWPTRTS